MDHATERQLDLPLERKSTHGFVSSGIGDLIVERLAEVIGSIGVAVD